MTATARSPTPAAGSLRAPAAAWPTSPASAATSPPHWPPSPPWAGRAATTASWATSTSHGNIDHAVTAFDAARTEAEQHDAPGERAIAQTLLALACAFADPLRTDDELALAHQLLAQIDQRATALLAQVAALVRDAGTDRDLTDRATVLRTEITVAGLAWLTLLLETALAFHHAVRGAQDDLTTTIDRLREATANGDFAYFVRIATAMGDLPQTTGPAIQWLDDEMTVRARWRALVSARRNHLASQP